MDYKPPFHLTDRMTVLVAEISEQVGRISVLRGDSLTPRLRRENRIRTIRASLAFSDGNGRIGRMWHSLLLGQWKELFFWLPVEELIKSRQKEYYDALGTADKKADSSGFVELMLELIRDSLGEVAI